MPKAFVHEVAALSSMGGGRLSSARLDGSKIWFKRYGAERRLFGKWMHAAISPLLFPNFLRSSPWLAPLAQAEREYRKMTAFAAAGFRVPHVIHRGGGVIAMMDAGKTLPVLLDRLRAEGNAGAHDDYLIELARTLGRIHAAGLCHGRPNPRDFVVSGKKLGVLDFEEEPEAAMPLASAQARDVWLLFFHLPALAMLEQTPRRALDTYFSIAPPGIADELARIARFFQRVVPLAELAGRIHLGGDLRRFLDAMWFFRSVTAAGRPVEAVA